MSDNIEHHPFVDDPGSPLPPLEGHVSQGRFERVLRAGHFAVTSEIAPPDSADADEVYRRAELFDGVVDAINALGENFVLNRSNEQGAVEIELDPHPPQVFVLFDQVSDQVPNDP